MGSSLIEKVPYFFVLSISISSTPSIFAFSISSSLEVSIPTLLSKKPSIRRLVGPWKLTPIGKEYAATKNINGTNMAVPVLLNLSAVTASSGGTMAPPMMEATTTVDPVFVCFPRPRIARVKIVGKQMDSKKSTSMRQASREN